MDASGTQTQRKIDSSGMDHMDGNKESSNCNGEEAAQLSQSWPTPRESMMVDAPSGNDGKGSAIKTAGGGTMTTMMGSTTGNNSSKTTRQKSYPIFQRSRVRTWQNGSTSQDNAQG